jgi:hypothetical protein
MVFVDNEGNEDVLLRLVSSIASICAVHRIVEL